MSKLVTIYGGSGFVGRYIARRMAKEGWRVRVACRRPNEAIFVRPYGVVGQVEPIFCNIRDDDSVRAAMHGADAVVNCVGTFDKGGKNNFDAVQHEGAERIARIAAAEGIERLVHVSAIGADAEGASLYARSKGKGEEGILEHMPGAVILRPSVVFGPEDAFFNRFAAMTRLGPILPIIGGATKFQPVYVDDVAQAAEKALLGQAQPGVYELGGPDVMSFRELMAVMLDVIRRRRLVVNIPFFVASIIGSLSDFVQSISLGLVPAQVTADQVRSLRQDNVVSDGAKGLRDLGIAPTSVRAVLPDYLWRFRPSGQYEAIKESAQNLRSN
ncbi:complex I NDUFA9 subunit family protein [Mameliella alba]|nr:complex I NDUFA9 subunit family protein [Antarctobacter heliothermus]MBY6142907.1 complex I NDUFA9 subunit family protein [Mameliella alba]MCA0953368.1 complex I NDUFA9 subunit family protein [Mameliella alba]